MQDADTVPGTFAPAALGPALRAPLIAATAWLVLGLSAVYLAKLAPGPQELCLFRNATGLPCPCCGATRAAGMIVRGDVVGAVVLNPLVSAMYLAGAAWLARALFGRARGAWSGMLRAVPGGALAVGVLVVLVAANWAYVLLTQG